MAVIALLRVGVSSPDFRVEALRVGFIKGPLPLHVCSVPKAVSAEASEAHAVKVNLWAARAGVCCSAQRQPNFASLSPLCLSQT